MYNMYAFQLTILFTIVRLLLIYTYVHKKDFQMVVLHEAVSFLLFFFLFIPFCCCTRSYRLLGRVRVLREIESRVVICVDRIRRVDHPAHGLNFIDDSYRRRVVYKGLLR